MSLTVVHSGLANAALIYFAILAVWGLVRFARRQGVGSSYWGALVIAELLILAQGTIMGDDPTNRELTIKVADVPQEQLVTAMEELGLKMLDARYCTSPSC